MIAEKLANDDMRGVQKVFSVSLRGTRYIRGWYLVWPYMEVRNGS